MEVRPIFDPKEDVEALQAAFNGDKSTIGNIVDIICNRKNSERQEIIQTYLGTYGEPIKEKLEKKLSGSLKALILGLMKTPVEYDAEQLYLSMKGAGTNEALLDEIIVTRPASHISQVREIYPTLYKATLEEDIKGDTSGVYLNLLIALLQGNRGDNPYPNTKAMQKVVDELREKDPKTGEDKNKLDKDNYVKCFSLRSFGELCTICRLYEKTYNTPLVKDIKKSFKGDDEELFLIIMNYISDPGSFFAKLINKDEKDAIIRIMISRSEVDMDSIREAYKELYNKELVDDIKEKYKDEYQRALLILAQK